MANLNTEKCFKYETQAFKLQVSLTQGILRITLRDFKTWILYSKQYFQQDVDDQIQPIITLGNVYDAFTQSLSPQSEKDTKLSQYNYGTIIKKDEIDCYRVEAKGQIIVYIYKMNAKRVKTVYTLLQFQLTPLKDIRRDSLFDQKKDKIQQPQVCLVKKHQKDQQLNLTKLLKQIELQTKRRHQQFYNQRLKNKQIGKDKNGFDIIIYPSTTGNIAKIVDRVYKCSVGRNGVCPPSQKIEGDGKTPLGDYALRQIWVRKDRVPDQIYRFMLTIGIPVNVINTYDGWCDEPTSPYYNRHVDLRFFDTSISHQNLWLETDLYDCFFVIGYNDQPVVPGKGCAIFFHIARPNYSGTAGCVAVAKSDLWEILKYLTDSSRIIINNYQKEDKI